MTEIHTTNIINTYDDITLCEQTKVERGLEHYGDPKALSNTCD